jgi:hypothetical protein
MRRFLLPLAGFPVSFPATAIEPHVTALKDALEQHDLLWLAAGKDPESISPEDLATSLTRVGAAGEAFLKSLEASEFLGSIPRRTAQLIFASFVAQSFGLEFEIIDLQEERGDKGKIFWWVTGCVVNRRGQREERPGTSFQFEAEHEKIAEGALLSACADAFIHCVFAMVPYFPWDRWNIVSEPTT